MLNLDTHIVIYALTDQLTIAEREILASDEWGISDIVIWEIAKLNQRRRIELDLDTTDLTRMFSRLHVWPITLDVGRAIRQLDFKSDPADEIIAATSIVHGVALVTRDGKLRKSRVVPIAG